jgi:hypothetical protein
VETLVKVAASITTRGILAAFAGAAIVAGCHKPQKQPPPMVGGVTFSEAQYPTRKEDWQTQQIPAPIRSDAPIKTGRPPLVYMTEAAGTIRVSDITTGQELVSPLEVPARTLISVNTGMGVSIGGASVRRGPLADDHEYGIYLVDPGNNTFRTGTIREGRPPLQAPPPASQPGGAP